MPNTPPTSKTRRFRGIAKVATRLRKRREAGKLPSRFAASIILLTLLALAFAVWPFLKCHLQAVAVLDLVANQPLPTPLRKIIAEPVTTTDFSLPTSQGPLRARLYTPVNHPNAPALVVLHGVHHLGMDEPRLIAFASAMSACGLRVLTPELPDIKDYHVGANSIASIGDSAKWLAQKSVNRDDYKYITPPGYTPVGVMGLSFSGGLSLLAASDPRYRDYIKFVVAIGSQYEMARVAEYYRTGQDARPNGGEELLPPHEYGALVLEYESLEDFISNPQDLAPIRSVLRAHLYEDPAAERAALAALTSQQLTEAKALMDTTSPATRAALARSEAMHIEGMAGVSPRGHLKTLTTPVYLLHGEGDNIIPSAETQWMADELPTQTLQAELISPVISHLDLDGHAPGALDRWRLVHFFALVLRAAEKP